MPLPSHLSSAPLHFLLAMHCLAALPPDCRYPARHAHTVFPSKLLLALNMVTFGGVGRAGQLTALHIGGGVLHVLSDWHFEKFDPTSIKPPLHWNRTTLVKVKLELDFKPCAGDWIEEHVTGLHIGTGELHEVFSKQRVLGWPSSRKPAGHENRMWLGNVVKFPSCLTYGISWRRPQLTAVN